MNLPKIPGTLYDNNLSSYVQEVLQNVNQRVVVDDVPQKYRDLVAQAANGRSSITRGQLQRALRRGHDAILRCDKTFFVHTSPHSLFRLIGIGGDGILQPKEQKKAANKSPMARALLHLIATDRGSRYTNLIKMGSSR